MGMLMTVREAARYLGRSEAFVRSLCHSCVVESRRVNGRFYIPRTSLDVWLSPLPEREPTELKVQRPYVMPMQ